jgi:hypothetical protein
MGILLYYPFINNVIELIFHKRFIEIVLNDKIHFCFKSIYIFKRKKNVCVHYWKIKNYRGELGSQLILMLYKEVENWVTIRYHVLLGRGKSSGHLIFLKASGQEKNFEFFYRGELGGHIVILSSPKENSKLILL